MTEMLLDRRDRRVALGATGLLRQFNDAGVLEAADVHVAARYSAILGETDEKALLAMALTVRAARHGSICVDLETVAASVRETAVDEEAPTLLAELPWPDPAAWLAVVAGSPLVGEQVLRLEGSTIYLDRYWREEGQVCTDLTARLGRRPPEVDEARLEAGVLRVFPDEGYDEQRVAAREGARRWTTVLTGGPGTGKTTAVAGMLALLAEQHVSTTGRDPLIALCAPTGKAATRLGEAVRKAVDELDDPDDRARLQGLAATTMHSLLGSRRASTRFRHDRHNHLPHDVVVVDETSMVSLTMMARLLEALRPDTRLVLVGDPDQLSSVEAGVVLADVVEGLQAMPDSPVVRLRRTHRFGEEILALAEALRRGDADTAMDVLRAGGDSVELVDPDDEAAMARFTDDVATIAAEMRVAADQGRVEPALELLHRHRLLCAHREGRYGVSGWNRLVERLVGEKVELPSYDEWYAGRPVLVTVNDRAQKLNNGDIGVTLRRPDGRLCVVLADRRELAPTRLPEVQTMHAMTVHKSQGSQAKVISVVMPPEESPLLTRGLFYTAVTRAEDKVRVVGTEAMIRAAIGRTVQRASGLQQRLSEACAAAPGTAP